MVGVCYQYFDRHYIEAEPQLRTDVEGVVVDAFYRYRSKCLTEQANGGNERVDKRCNRKPGWAGYGQKSTHRAHKCLYRWHVITGFVMTKLFRFYVH